MEFKCYRPEAVGTASRPYQCNNKNQLNYITTLPINNAIHQFRLAMEKFGLVMDESMIADGRLHRFKNKGDKKKNSWYVIYLDGIPAGVFGCWRMGFSSTWRAKSFEKMSYEECLAHRRKMDDVKLKHDQDLALRQKEASKRANKIWSDAYPANPSHSYLLKKHILPFHARQNGYSLILPIIDCDNRLWSLQFIDPKGEKRLLSDGAKKGKFILLTGFENSSRVLIGEGFATCATLAQLYPGTTVVSAIDASNLEHVAIAMRCRLPSAEIVICCDDDRQTVGNPGLSKGRSAAIASGSLLSSPQWPEGSPNSLTDFNDLACWLRNTAGVTL